MIATIRRHPRLAGVIVLDVDGRECNALIGRFGPARLSEGDRGYLVGAEHTAKLIAFLTREGVQVVDDRSRDQGAGPSVGPATPLPECAACGLPRRRRRQVAGEWVELDPPASCVGCGAPWTDAADVGPPGAGVFKIDRPEPRGFFGAKLADQRRREPIARASRA